MFEIGDTGFETDDQLAQFDVLGAESLAFSADKVALWATRRAFSASNSSVRSLPATGTF